MKFLVTLAICAVCVSGESLTRHKRGWGYEPPPPPPPTQSSGWGWSPPQTTQPPPPPPPPPPTSGWGKPPPPTSGWGQPPPPQPPPPQNGWGSGSSSYYTSYSYPSYSSRYPRPWGQSRYGRYAEGPMRYREYRDRGDIYGSIRSPYSRRSSLM